QSFSRSRDIQRYLFANAADVTPDKQGRILIPQNLRDAAHLSKDVTVIGVMNHAEIWDKKRWEEKSRSIDADVFDAQMQELDL
ncbi:MAG: division/cell wall cluster transcriptional repressor MraZ, partial [Oscillospiraceae bacterium]